MEKITLNRKDLYDRIWTTAVDEFSKQYCISREGLEQVCDRLNVPFPDKSYHTKLSQGKNPAKHLLPDNFRGAGQATLYQRNDTLRQQQHAAYLTLIAAKLGMHENQVQTAFDPLVQSTEEGIFLHWEKRAVYQEKSKLLDVRVSPELLWRALGIFDLLIKMLQYKGYRLVVQERHTFALIEGEKVPISIRERNRRIEFTNDFNRTETELHPSGILYLKREGGYTQGWEWKNTKSPLEEQIPDIVQALFDDAQRQKADRERYRIAREERQQSETIRQEKENRQRTELQRLKKLVAESHQFTLAQAIRAYINKVEEDLTLHGTLTDENKGWLSWARQKADWCDPTVTETHDEILKGIDLDNLSSYTGYAETSSSQRDNNFWKPWWAK